MNSCAPPSAGGGTELSLVPCGVVLVGTGGHQERPAVQRQLHHRRPHRRVHMVIHADHPGGPGEKPGMPGLPTRVRRARHRVSPDEARLQAGRDHLVEHRAFDAGDIGKPTIGGGLADMGQQGRQRRHRHGQDDQRIKIGGPGQRLGEIGGGIEVVETGGLSSLDRAVVAEGLTTGSRGGAQNRAADQSQAQHAHRCLRHPSRLAYLPGFSLGYNARPDPDLLVMCWSMGPYATSVGAHGSTAGFRAGGHSGWIRCGCRA